MDSMGDAADQLTGKQVKPLRYWWRVLLLGVHMQQIFIKNVSTVYLLVCESVSLPTQLHQRVLVI